MTTRKAKSTKRSAKKAAKPAKKAVKASARGKTRRGKNGGGIRVRMYRVGFGDFFVVIVPTKAGDQYILIDCGVFKGTSGTGDIGSIVEAVEDLYRTTNGHLALVIMTHRHADHIAGFSKAERFKEFTASMVWMPYWEQFNEKKKKKDPSKNLQLDAMVANLTSVALQLANGQEMNAEEAVAKLRTASAIEAAETNSAYDLLVDIHDLAAKLALQFRGRDDEDGREALAQLGNATGIEDFNAAATDKKKLSGNDAALDLLKNKLGENGKNVRYYAANDDPELPDELKGLKATILGPPPEKAKAFLALMDLKKGVGQYLDSTSDDGDGPSLIQPFAKEWVANLNKDYPQDDLRARPIIYDDVITAVKSSQPDMLVAAAAKIENFLNNQSLVVLFEFDGKKLLFAGDAQGGNWEYWLYQTEDPVKNPTDAGEILAKSQEILKTIDFYKVGHHGSTNATPIPAIQAAIARAGHGKGFVSMCSTEAKVYGDEAKGTEVPRKPLMEAIANGSCLIRSDAIDIRFPGDNGKEKTVKKNKAVTLPEPKAGKLRHTDLYLEYEL